MDPDDLDARDAAAYAAHWAPLLAPAGRALLDWLPADLGRPGPAVLDAGTGTGTLATAAARRWPGARVTALDPSPAMLALAAAAVGTLPAQAAARVDLRAGRLEHLPAVPGGWDLVTAAFVVGLLPRRLAALRAAVAVLRPGGWLAIAAWLASPARFAPDVAFDAALAAAGLEPRGEPDGSGDLPTAGAAGALLRRAGLGQVRTRTIVLRHEFGPEGWLAFLAGWDAADLFASLAPAARDRLRDDVLARVGALPAGARRLELPVVLAAGRRPT